MKGLLLISLSLPLAAGAAMAQTIVDHSCTDLEDVPLSWIDAVRAMDSHYAHTSHGSQLTYGMQFVEEWNSYYDVSIGNCYLPSTQDAYCVFDGQIGQGYITPDLYWETEDGLDMTRAVLDANPTISTSMWSWCTQCDSYSEEQVQAYLDAMTLLEGEYPGVTFVYMTGNAQSTGSSGYNRWLRNQQIRDYCTASDKVLFDFEDLDCWWFDPASQQWEQHTYTYGSYQIPSEHPQFYGDEYGHTTAGSCTQKGRAWWYMMALIAGWGGTGIEEDGAPPAPLFTVECNPARGSARVSASGDISGPIEMNVYDTSGRLACRLFSGEAPGGRFEVVFTPDAPGVYLLRCSSGDRIETQRLAVIR
ncbi:MAG TPA: T9SS type A sorting domain-containing protein [Candidatus Fermentibacter sp.]|nr:T9SS type A sorting domain-containing protein [Candidatus Fermentibacter sp.]